MDKSKMLRTVTAIAAIFFATQGFAAGGGVLWEAEIEPGNIASLQRGARNFMNYCSGCHSAQYVRYNTIGKHLELSEEQLIENLMFNADKTFEPIRAAMPSEDAARWYGTAPPDLSLMARARGADHIYTFLKGFYVDPDSPTGVDNVRLPGTSMPHVLWELQGYQEAVFAEHTEDDVTTYTFEHFEPITSGSMDEEDYDNFVRDTVNFLVFIAEPIRSDRRVIGTWVIIYLIVFFVIAAMLKKQIWKDVK
jgi:ubiquinol-cytochrome c reductase cytochrome c1 subunit